MANDLRQPNTILTTNTGYNRKWILNKSQLDIVSKVITNENIWTNMNYLFNNPSEFLVNVKAYPFDVQYFLGDNSYSDDFLTNVTIGNNITMTSDGETVKGYKFTDKVTSHRITLYDGVIDRKFNNFLDYAPYTKIEIYIPYIQIFEIDSTLIIGKHIKIDFAVDFDSGSCTCWIFVDNDNTNNWQLLQTRTGKCGVDIPLGASNAVQQGKQQLESAVQAIIGTLTAVIGFSTGNPLIGAGGVGTVIGASKNVFNSAENKVEKGNLVNGSKLLINPVKPTFIITRYKINGDGINEYKHYKGLPLEQNKKLKELSGYTILSNIHLEYIQAMSSELKELENILKTGFII